MSLLKDYYATPTALFTGITLPTSDYNTDIESAIYGRWRLNELCMDDLTEWRIWFQFLCDERWPIAVKLMESAALIQDPIKTMNLSTGTTGSSSLTDTLRIDREGESADATSGYNNEESESGSNSSSTDTPGVVSTVKTSDTPQSAVNPITNGYLSGVTETSQSGSDTSSAESSATGSNNRNYLDASSHNHNDSEQHSGGNSTEYGSTVTQEGFSGNQAQLLLEYRKTLTNIRRQVADLFSDAFSLIYGMR